MEIFNGYKSYFEFQLFYHSVIAKSSLSVEFYCRENTRQKQKVWDTSSSQS